MKKIKQLLGLLKPDPIKNRDELLGVCSAVAVTQLKRDTIVLQRDAEIQLIKDKYDAQIEQLGSQAEHDVKRIQGWAIANREIEFGKRQELLIAGHSLAFRKSPGAVEVTPGMKERDVVDAIINAEGPEAEELQELLLSVKPSLNKENILREWRRNGGTLPDAIAMFGLGVSEPTTFTFTPARTELPATEHTSAVGKEAA